MRKVSTRPLGASDFFLKFENFPMVISKDLKKCEKNEKPPIFPIISQKLSETLKQNFQKV
jgi:hypothetical protein